MYYFSVLLYSFTQKSKHLTQRMIHFIILIKQWWPIMNKLVAGHSRTMLKPLKGLIDRGLSILRMNVWKYDNEIVFI